MKHIINWKITFIDEFGKEGIGLLLPGCTVKGKILENMKEVSIQTIDVDTSNLIITSVDGEQYLLLDASREYLQDMKKCIEFGLKERDGEER